LKPLIFGFIHIQEAVLTGRFVPVDKVVTLLVKGNCQRKLGQQKSPRKRAFWGASGPW